MADSTDAKTVAATGASDEQKRYGAVLGVLMKIGLAGILVTFILYVTGILKPHVPLSEVHNFWSLKGDKYLEEIGVQKGWTWLNRLSEGDFLNFAPIALLASVTMFCYLTVIPIFLKKKDKVYAALATLEILILMLAASGVLPSGGH